MVIMVKDATQGEGDFTQEEVGVGGIIQGESLEEEDLADLDLEDLEEDIIREEEDLASVVAKILHPRVPVHLLTMEVKFAKYFCTKGRKTYSYLFLIQDLEGQEALADQETLADQDTEGQVDLVNLVAKARHQQALVLQVILDFLGEAEVQLPQQPPLLQEVEEEEALVAKTVMLQDIFDLCITTNMSCK
jgi:hypothetical protein